MNLAEIRKKARREKEAERPLPVERSFSPSRFATEPPEPVEPAPGEPLSVPSETSFNERPTIPDLPPAPAVPEAPRDVFDPVSIIIAGRLSAGTAVEQKDQPGVISEEADDRMKYLRFRVDDEDYGVSLMEIREIIKARPVTEVPHMPAFVAGVLSLRGTIIPVLDLRLRLGLAVGETTGRERIIIAKKGEGMCGLLVDEVFQVIGLSGAEMEKAPPVLDGIDREFVRGIGRHGEKMLIILDMDKVMDVQLR